MFGTVGFMAPEQVRGEAADARSDIFALSCVLYEMLAGQRAFGRGTMVETMTAILREPVPEVSLSGTDASPHLNRIVAHCLEKASGERFQSASDVAFALRGVGSTTQEVPSVAAATMVPSRHRRGWLVPVGLGVLAVAMAGWLGWTLRGREGTGLAPQTVRFSVANADEAYAAAGTGMGYSRQFALSPDGRQLVLIARDRGRTQLAVRSLDSQSLRMLPSTEGASAPFWSPDGGYVAFIQGGALKKIALATGGVETIYPLDSSLGGSWSESGELVVADWKGMWRVPATGGQPQPV